MEGATRDHHHHLHLTMTDQTLRPHHFLPIMMDAFESVLTLATMNTAPCLESSNVHRLTLLMMKTLQILHIGMEDTIPDPPSLDQVILPFTY